MIGGPDRIPNITKDNMFIAKTNKQIFYCSGKCATHTISSIPGIIINTPTKFTLNLREEAVSIAKKLLVSKNRNCELIFLIREPKDRLISGLYEVIFKRTFLVWIEYLALSEESENNLQELLKIFTDELFWSMALDRYFRLTPHKWDSDTVFDSHREKYHYGNWLSDVLELIEYADSIKWKWTTLDISNLDNFLSSKNIEYTTKNTKNDIFYIPKYKGVSKKIDELYNGEQIFKAFMSALNNMPSNIQENLKNYISKEQKIYKLLLEKYSQT